MPTLVSIEAYSGTLRRYEQVDRATVRLSHIATSGHRETFTASVVEEFRRCPDSRFAVAPEFDPDPPPAAKAALFFA